MKERATKVKILMIEQHDYWKNPLRRGELKKHDDIRDIYAL
jgi:hypothetical protein